MQLLQVVFLQIITVQKIVIFGMEINVNSMNRNPNLSTKFMIIGKTLTLNGYKWVNVIYFLNEPLLYYQFLN